MAFGLDINNWFYGLPFFLIGFFLHILCIVSSRNHSTVSIHFCKCALNTAIGFDEPPHRSSQSLHATGLKCLNYASRSNIQILISNSFSPAIAPCTRGSGLSSICRYSIPGPGFAEPSLFVASLWNYGRDKSLVLGLMVLVRI